MTYDEFNQFCSSLPQTNHVVQWNQAHVWKVGGKVFAIGGWGENRPAYTFKTTDLSFDILKEQPGLRPAPYLASRGMKWIQHYHQPGLDDDALKDYLHHSYIMVVAKLTKKKRAELGLD